MNSKQKGRLMEKRVGSYYEKCGFVVHLVLPSILRIKGHIRIKGNDIFHAFDGCALRTDRVVFFQVTSLSNKSSRMKKVRPIPDVQCGCGSSKSIEQLVWCYDDTHKVFDVFQKDGTKAFTIPYGDCV